MKSSFEFLNSLINHHEDTATSKKVINSSRIKPKSFLDELSLAKIKLTGLNNFNNNNNCNESFGANCKNSDLKKNSLADEIAIMEIILRFLQLLCENHNFDLQNYLRIQANNKTSYNLVCETLKFLDCICGSTTGGLGLLGLWINESNVHLVNQTMQSLTEYCQGPCHENQFSIINHDSNGIDIVISLMLNDIQPLSSINPELYYALKDNASKLLLALMESNEDSDNAGRILMGIKPKTLVAIIQDVYSLSQELSNLEQTQNALSNSSFKYLSSSSLHSEVSSNSTQNTLIDVNKTVRNYSVFNLSSESSSIDSCELKNNSKNKNETLKDAKLSSSFQNENPETKQSDKGSRLCEVGHNLYILGHKLAKFDKELNFLLKMKDKSDALFYYSDHTGQIEIIREDRAMEQIVFPVPILCEYLTQETKQHVFMTTEKDDQDSKIGGFFESTKAMFNEMKWQKKLRQHTWLYWLSSHMSLFGSFSFDFALIINLLVAMFYPFEKGLKGLFFVFNKLLLSPFCSNISFLISFLRN